jgi:hypothetical protein
VTADAAIKRQREGFALVVVASNIDVLANGFSSAMGRFNDSLVSRHAKGLSFASPPSGIAHGVFDMTKKVSIRKASKRNAKVAHPGMMGDGTEEQNLGERGNPAARIKRKEVVAAFGKKRRTK